MKPRRSPRSLPFVVMVFLVMAGVLAPASPASASVPGISGLTATRTSSSITLRWQPPASPHGNSFVGAIIRRAAGNVAPTVPTAGTDVTTTSSGTTHYTDKHLQPNRTYSYAVFAKFQNGSVSGAATKTVTTLTSPITNLEPTRATPTTITLSWKNPGESGFLGAYLARDKGTTAPTELGHDSKYNDWVFVAKTDKGVDHYTDIGLTPGTTYSYAVFAQYSGISSTAAKVTVKARSIAWSNAGTGTDVGLDDVFCTSATFCAAPGGGFAAQLFNGTSWGTQYQWDDPSGDRGEIAEISCSSRYYCLAVNDYGDAAFYSGDAWQASQNLDTTSSGGFQSVSCIRNAEFCVATDADGWAYTFVDGRAPTVARIDPNASEVLGPVSCATTDFCVVTAGSSHRYTFNGHEWTRSSLGSAAGHGLIGGGPVSCLSTSFCMEVATTGQSEIFTGKSWTRVNDLPIFAGDPVDSVSCATTTYCMAITQDGEVAVYAGVAPEGAHSPKNIGEWDWSRKPKAEEQMDAVSCGSTTLCVVVGETGPNADGFSLLARS